MGSQTETTGANAAVTSRTEYDAFGVEFNLQSGTKGPFRFAGKHGYVTDDQSGLLMLGARYYMPMLGRFFTQDPIGHEGGLNLYAYCDNNPLSKVDPNGKDWDWSQYSSDVGGVFKGYGNVLYGTVRSPITTAEFLGAWAGNDWSYEFGKGSVINLCDNFYSGITGERGAEGFGESFGTALLTAAPFMKGIKNPTPLGLEGPFIQDTGG